MRNKKRDQNRNRARELAELGGEMMANALQGGGVPEIVIAAKAGSAELSQVDYYIVSRLEGEKIRYILSRVLGLLDGSIGRNN